MVLVLELVLVLVPSQKFDGITSSIPDYHGTWYKVPLAALYVASSRTMAYIRTFGLEVVGVVS